MQAKEQEIVGPDQSGLLLVGHGTRSNRGRVEFQETVDLVKSLMPDAIVHAGFLEGGDPTIASAWDALVGCGVKRIIVSPLLLFAAGHANRDIPQILRRLAAKSPTVHFRQTSPLGCDPAMIELSVNRYQCALDAASSQQLQPTMQTRMLFVARGALDPVARDQALEYARLVAAAAKPDEYSTCFLAMAKPTFAEVVAATAVSSFQRVVVVPHLLFSGKLLRRVRDTVAEQEQGGLRQQWILADHLGPDLMVARLIARRFSDALTAPC
jgi:sirohydrochlorin cobaltochelatase